MTEREAFEAYMSDNGAWPRAVERNAAGDYKLMHAASSWPVWCAAWAAARADNLPPEACAGSAPR